MRNSVIESDLKYVTTANLPWTKFQNKTVLISGASGFLASYMVETLLYLNETRDLNTKVVGIVRDLEKARKRFAHLVSDPRLELLEHDVCQPLSLDGPIHSIIHAASIATPKLFSSHPIDTILPNVKGTENLLELAVAKRVETFLFFSTTGVYGYAQPEKYPLTETTFGGLDPMQLASVYVESKRMGETLCVAWRKQHGLPIKVVRPAITYGPGVQLDDGRSFADFIGSILKHKDIELFSEGKAIRNFCYIADAILGFFVVMLRGQAGEAYNVATDHEISIIDLANFLVDEVFPERKLKVVLKTPASNKQFLRMEFPRTTVDIRKTQELGWELGFPIAAGFKRTIQSFEESSQC